MVKFLKEEQGQTSLDFLLVLGGIIVAAAITFVVYTGTVKHAGEAVNESARNLTDAQQSEAQEWLEKV